MSNPAPPAVPDHATLQELVQQLQTWASELGFADLRINALEAAKLREAETRLLAWLAAGYHGEMDYMASHGTKRAQPAQLLPGTMSVISARMNYLPADTPPDWRAREWQKLEDARAAQVSMYARGRDYHKVLRHRLQQLAEKLDVRLQQLAASGLLPAHSLQARAFTDSAPVQEVELAQAAGLGWRGKHTLLLTRDAGSMFFLGEIFVNLALPPSSPGSAHCGQCRACLDICPTAAILAPGLVDARRCISYLTIELKGSIPRELRPLLGNRIYGCDDCQLACPWNKFAQKAVLPDFEVRHGLDNASLLQLFAWDEAEFLQKMEGSAIRRIGHERWLRNLAVGLGNAARSCKGEAAIVQALQARLQHPSELVREHVAWALEMHGVIMHGIKFPVENIA